MVFWKGIARDDRNRWNSVISPRFFQFLLITHVFFGGLRDLTHNNTLFGTLLSARADTILGGPPCTLLGMLIIEIRSA